MIKIINGRSDGNFMLPGEYYKGKSLPAKCVMRITKRYRAAVVLKCMKSGKRHLDIGCGDGYFAKRSTCEEVYALDAKYGDWIDKRIDFPDNFFDYVTMLAVLEHFKEPDMIFKEAYRVLKVGGQFILTTPKRKSERIIRFYVPVIGQLHEHYFDYDSIKGFSSGAFGILKYKTFFMGMNQLFCLEKIGRPI